MPNPEPHGDLYWSDFGDARTLEQWLTANPNVKNWAYVRMQYKEEIEDVDLYDNPEYPQDHSKPQYLPEKFLQTNYYHWSYFFDLGKRYFTYHGISIPFYFNERDIYGTFINNAQNAISCTRWISGRTGVPNKEEPDDYSSGSRSNLINAQITATGQGILVVNADTELPTLVHPYEEEETYDKTIGGYEFTGLKKKYRWSVDYLTEPYEVDAGDYESNGHYVTGGQTIDLSATWQIAEGIVVNGELPDSLYMEDNPTSWYFDDDHKLVLPLMPAILENKLGAFSGCSTLKTVIIPDTCTSIGRWSFYGTGIMEVELPENCTYYATSFPEDCVITGGELIT